jgi:hypothetical protein
MNTPLGCRWNMIAVIICFAATVGCAQLTPRGWRVSSVKPPITQIASLWQVSRSEPAKGKAAGFIGQVFFFNASAPEPQTVDGTVTVSIYDDVVSSPEPLDRIEFNAAQWRSYLHQTTFGPGYLIFVPHRAARPFPARCRIQVTFNAPGQSGGQSDVVTVAVPPADVSPSIPPPFVPPPPHSAGAPFTPPPVVPQVTVPHATAPAQLPAAPPPSPEALTAVRAAIQAEQPPTAGPSFLSTTRVLPPSANRK